MRAWRARLKLRRMVRPRPAALSVAAFIDTMRMTCSLTAASLNAWKSDTITDFGSRSPRSSAPDGLNS